MIPVKICGITSVKDAQLAIEKGASAIGLIFYDPSPRNVSIEIAKEIVDHVNDSVPIVGVFVDENIQIIKSILSQVNIDILQLHGSESPQYCEQFNLPIIKYSDLDDAIDRANALDMGLGGSVWSSDPERAAEIASRLECGTAWVNGHGGIAPNVPFGGVKCSGIGVEFAEEGLHEYTTIQIVNVAKAQT